MRIRIHGPQRRASAGTGWALVILLWVLTPTALAIEVCQACKKEIRGDTIITWTDEVTRTKHYLCADCPKLHNRCYLCSLPVMKDFTSLPDGRVICKRDVKTVIIDEKQAIQICEQVKEELDRQFIRFISFPTTNVTIQLMDRVNLQEMYKVIGSDFTCPNTRGYTWPKTNDGQRTFEIGILSGVQKEELMTVCVHEYAHAWLIENMPPAREKTIGDDAVEGFCELLAYLYAEQYGLMAGKSNILANYYTRGQIHLFIAAHRQYGFDEIVDWMKAGEDALLQAEDLGRLRRLEDSPKTRGTATNPPAADPAVVEVVEPRPLPREPILQGITWSKAQPTAIINGQSFGTMDLAVIKLAPTNVLIRCLSIRTNSVLIQFDATGEKQELFLPGKHSG